MLNWKCRYLLEQIKKTVFLINQTIKKRQLSFMDMTFQLKIKIINNKEVSSQDTSFQVEPPVFTINCERIIGHESIFKNKKLGYGIQINFFTVTIESGLMHIFFLFVNYRQTTVINSITLHELHCVTQCKETLNLKVFH